MAAAVSEVEYTYSAHTVPKPQGFSTTPRSLAEFVRQHTGDTVFVTGADTIVIKYKSTHVHEHVVRVELDVFRDGIVMDGIAFTISFHDSGSVNVSARSDVRLRRFRRRYQLTPLFHPAALMRRIMDAATGAVYFGGVASDCLTAK